MAKKRAPTVQRVVKRAADAERQRLPPEFEAFAGSDEKRLRRPPRPRDPGRLDDPRVGFAIAGVANRDARAVYDVRIERLRQLWAGGKPEGVDLETLGDQLCDAARLELWRARRLTDFAAFAEDVIGIDPAEAQSLAQQGAARQGVELTLLSQKDVAVWLRTEAGLQATDPKAEVRLLGPEPRWSLTLASEAAIEGLAAVGARLSPMREERDERPPRGPRDSSPRPERRFSGDRGRRPEGDEREERDSGPRFDGRGERGADSRGERGGDRRGDRGGRAGRPGGDRDRRPRAGGDNEGGGRRPLRRKSPQDGARGKRPPFRKKG